MNCESARRAILLQLYGEIDAREHFKMDTHLSGCPSCRDAVAAERRLFAMLQAGAGPDPSDDVLDRCRDSLARALDQEAPPPPTPLGVRLLDSWRQVRLSPAYGFAMLMGGFLAGALTLHAGRAGFPGPGGEAAVSGSAAAQERLAAA